MSADDWFRRTTWNDAARENFNVRLKRARKYNRPQYLRIQAWHLADAGNHYAALELLDQFMQIDDGSIDLAQAQLQRAESFLALGNEQDAVRAFHACLDAERNRPNVQTEAWLLFPWYVVETENKQLYPKAHEVLDEFFDIRSKSFPVSGYRYHCVKALLLAHDGDVKQAKAHATRALAAADAKHSGYSYHAKLGLVTSTNNTVHQRALSIAAT
jgi:tetratricopeptide (TPR) repeat protein